MAIVERSFLGDGPHLALGNVSSGQDPRNYGHEMVRLIEESASDGPVVRIPDDFPKVSVDEWLSLLMREDPIELPISAAELVAETRREVE